MGTNKYLEFLDMLWSLWPNQFIRCATCWFSSTRLVLTKDDHTIIHFYGVMQPFECVMTMCKTYVCSLGRYGVTSVNCRPLISGMVSLIKAECAFFPTTWHQILTDMEDVCLHVANFHSSKFHLPTIFFWQSKCFRICSSEYHHLF